MLDFARHLPPSAGLPRVLALDQAAAAALPPEAAVTLASRGRLPAGPFDAVVGWGGPADFARWFDLLRPGGRLLLASREDSQTLIQAMTRAGYIHCLVERDGDVALYRGERPPASSPLDRIANLLNASPGGQDERNPSQNSGSNSISISLPPFLHLLISQTPNKPPWKLEPGERLRWTTATAVDPHSGQKVLLAFGSLVKAVAFMQPAVLARQISGVNKIARFPSAHVRAWSMPFTLDPTFDEWRQAVVELTLEVDPRAAIADEQ